MNIIFFSFYFSFYSLKKIKISFWKNLGLFKKLFYYVKPKMSARFQFYNFIKLENADNRVDFLDGYRGTLALWVFLQHCNYVAKIGGDFSYFDYPGYCIGVIGFFILSSYLLTYRLLVEINKTNSNKNTLLIFIKYTIRRFFRVYIPFLIICSLIKFVSNEFGGPFDWDSFSWYQLVFLNESAGSHLWTIAPEVKYYFFIPVYAYVANKMNKSLALKWTWFLINIIFLFGVEYFSLFNEFDSGGNFKRANSSFLTRFTTFYLGSFLAFILYNVHEMEIYKNSINKSHVRQTLGTIALLMYLYGMILFSQKLTPSLKGGKHFFLSGLYWTFFMLFFILSQDNYFTRFFNGSFLYFYGKFSFGFYLWHMGIIGFFYKHYNDTVRLKMEIVFYSFVCSFIAGCLFYYIIEKPLMKLANKLCYLISDSKFFSFLIDEKFYKII